MLLLAVTVLNIVPALVDFSNLLLLVLIRLYIRLYFKLTGKIIDRNLRRVIDDPAGPLTAQTESAPLRLGISLDNDDRKFGSF